MSLAGTLAVPVFVVLSHLCAFFISGNLANKKRRNTEERR